MNTNNKSQYCPICKESVYLMARYPNYICINCITKYGTYTEDNKKIDFYNIDHTGGFKSQIEGDNNFTNEHVCYVNNVKCFADEARFGGIVIQPYQ